MVLISAWWVGGREGGRERERGERERGEIERDKIDTQKPAHTHTTKQTHTHLAGTVKPTSQTGQGLQ